MTNMNVPVQYRRAAEVALVLGLFLVPFGASTAQAKPEPKTTVVVGDILNKAQAGALPTSAALMLRQRNEYPRAKIDSLVIGLERLAFGAATPVARMSAAHALANAGAGENPLPGAFDRIVSVYRRSDEGLVRRAVISQMPIQYDKARAIRFLKGVAIAPADKQDFSQASAVAVETLSYMGSPGRIALAELRDSGGLVDPRARGFVDCFFRKR
jgi:hypothetical protein